MLFENPRTELIQLNEESIWAGSQINNNNPEALKNLPAFPVFCSNDDAQELSSDYP